MDVESAAVGTRRARTVRAAERRRLDDLVRTAGSGPACLVLLGDPGMGKSALLDHLADPPGMRTLRARGRATEAALPFAALADVLIPLRRYFAAPPKAQRAALEVCLALAEGRQSNPYAACAGTLGVLAAAARERPLLILVDDLDRIDPASRRTLLFAARRLRSERVGMVFAARAGAAARELCDGLPQLEIARLSDTDCGALLDARGRTAAPAVLEWLVRVSAGNPLVLLETAAALTPAQRAGDAPVPDDPPVGDLLHRSWTRELLTLPEQTRDALVVAAASRSSSLGVLEAALCALGVPPDALASAEDANVLRTACGEYAFRHPIMPSVLLSRVPPAKRSRVFQALADTSSGAMRAWYRADASCAPDERVALALTDAALRSRRHGAYDASALAWRRAADLTPDPDGRAERLLNAADDAFMSGSAARAEAWCDEALHTANEPVLRAGIASACGRVRTFRGRPWEAHEQLVEAARTIRPVDAGRADALLTEAITPAVLTGRIAVALRYAERCAGTVTLNGAVLRASALTLAGRTARARRLLDGRQEALDRADPVADQQVLVLAAQCRGWMEEDAAARRMLTAVIDTACRRGVPAVLPVALAARSEIDWWAGRWTASYADAGESLRWCRELGQLSALGHCLACLARLDALRGDRGRCERRVLRAWREAGDARVTGLQTLLISVPALVALADREYEHAARQLERAFAQDTAFGFGNPNVCPLAADLAEAHIMARDLCRAAEIVDYLDERGSETGLTWPAAAVARCRGLMSDDREEAESWFALAEAAHRRRDMPYEHARTLLCQGRALRRFRRPSAARAPLAAALAVFESLGALPWARRAAAELTAIGGARPDRRQRAGLDLLTPQELQVARVIAQGMNNVQAAAALHVSRKTIEAHLTRIYRKLQVPSRTALTRLLVTAGLMD